MASLVSGAPAGRSSPWAGVDDDADLVAVLEVEAGRLRRRERHADDRLALARHDLGGERSGCQHPALGDVHGRALADDLVELPSRRPA